MITTDENYVFFFFEGGGGEPLLTCTLLCTIWTRKEVELNNQMVVR